MCRFDGARSSATRSPRSGEHSDGAGALDQALTAQEQTGERLGETLVELGLICRPELDRAVAWQAGTQIDEESGFGTGLRAALERRHRYRRDFQAVFR